MPPGLETDKNFQNAQINSIKNSFVVIIQIISVIYNTNIISKTKNVTFLLTHI